MRAHERRLGTAALCFALISALALRAGSAAATGILVARGTDGRERGEFPLTRTEVRAEVTGRVVSVDVTQRFQNTFGERIEAVYAFPLPVEAAVDDMEMHIGARVVHAVVRRRAEAREAYVQAASRGQRAGLLEQERPNVFTVSVANVDPGGEIVVRLHYFELARYDHGTFEVAFPMTVGPRYNPGQAPRIPQAGHVTQSGHTVGLSVELDAGAPIQTVDAPAHAVDVQRTTPARATVSLRDLAEIPNRDFVLRWTVSAPEVQASLFVHRLDTRTDGYLALQLEPRHDAPESEIAAREIFFLLDTSGSMQGPPLEAAKAAVRRALATLHASDTFQIIDFADSASAFAPRPLANTPTNVQRAVGYLATLQASGGTNQLEGIRAALRAVGDPMRLRYVVFMTDGYIGNESAVIGLVQHELGQARIFGFGIGSSVNRYLLDEVSYAGRGTAEYIRPGEDPTAAIERFYERIGRPYLTDISVDWGGLAVDRVLPSPIPDLSTFEPLTVLARYREAGTATVTVRGRIAGRPFERRIAVALPAVATGARAISRVWGRARISSLSRALHLAGEQPPLVNEITEVALAHNLMSQYTSLVAIEDTPPEANVRQMPRRVEQPSEAPEGVDMQSAGGGTAPLGGSAGVAIVPPIYGTRSSDGDRRDVEFTNGTVRGEVLAAMPGSVVSEEVSVQSRHGRGCAGCAVGGEPGSDGRRALALVALGAALARARRARRRARG